MFKIDGNTHGKYNNNAHTKYNNAHGEYNNAHSEYNNPMKNLIYSFFHIKN